VKTISSGKKRETRGRTVAENESAKKKIGGDDEAGGRKSNNHKTRRQPDKKKSSGGDGRKRGVKTESGGRVTVRKELGQVRITGGKGALTGGKRNQTGRKKVLSVTNREKGQGNRGNNTI